MKKIALFVVALLMTVTVNAQFEQGKGYLGASMSGLDLSSQAKEFHFGLNARAGYFFMNSLMGIVDLGYDHKADAKDQFSLGAYGRYYLIKNGLYFGAGLKYKHAGGGYNDLLPGAQLGYAFFLSRTVTVEPELYFDLSTKKFGNSCYGLRVGIGVYLFKDQYTFKR